MCGLGWEFKSDWYIEHLLTCQRSVFVCNMFFCYYVTLEFIFISTYKVSQSCLWLAHSPAGHLVLGSTALCGRLSPLGHFVIGGVLTMPSVV